jgi:hypothetical protein
MALSYRKKRYLWHIQSAPGAKKTHRLTEESLSHILTSSPSLLLLVMKALNDTSLSRVQRVFSLLILMLASSGYRTNFLRPGFATGTGNFRPNLAYGS